jgi:DSF synthase
MLALEETAVSSTTNKPDIQEATMTVVKQTFPPFGHARSGRGPLPVDGNLAVQARPLPDQEMLTRLAEMEVQLDSHARILWQYLKPAGRPSFTLGLLAEMRDMQRWTEGLFAGVAVTDAPVRYVVTASKMPGIFNLGGDLPHFVELIRAKDGATLRRYAHACIDVQYPRATNMGLPITSISLVQGDALGGGFECALAADIIIAEKRAKFGLPEILFNLYPGMGAYSFLARRLDAKRAEEMILSGRIYSAEELKEIGIVDVVAEDGQGEDAVYEYVDKHDRSFGAIRAVHQVRKMVRPVSREELIAITDLWVDTALTLEGSDLRKMERLAAAQDRRWAQIGNAA